MHSRNSLARGLRALGVAPGDVVMVHASCRKVGEVAGGPDEVHLAIKDVLTPSGTMMMYASCPRYYDEVGRGNLTPEQEAEILQNLPPFDADSARAARDNGALVEFFRSWPGSIVNNHVARFVAWGKQAEYLFSKQPWDFAFGRDSAFERFTELDGRILLLGSDHDNVTYLHYPEHIGDFPGKRIAHFKVPVLEQGNRVWRDMAEVDTAEAAHPNWPDRFFAQIVENYLKQVGNEGGLVGNARSYVFPARDLLAVALAQMTKVAGEAA